MRWAWAQATGLLVLRAILLRPILLLSILLGSFVLGAAVAGDAALNPFLLVGALGALLCAWGMARHHAVVLRSAAGGVPAVAARDHHRALARRAVPGQRDPDAAGHARSRAPSGPVPAV
ncbi:MAG: DUF6412 domain-containing protein [Pseudonocardia sp.]|nr:DUF6412 domain-containing protein [Pseudonocardia sp.]